MDESQNYISLESVYHHVINIQHSNNMKASNKKQTHSFLNNNQTNYDNENSETCSDVGF